MTIKESKENLINVIETNLFDLMRLVRHWPKIEMHDGPDMLWTASDIPFYLFNCVMRAHLAPEEINASIASAIHRSKARNVPMGWYVGPATAPPGLGADLLASGFCLESTQIGMAMDLQKLDESPQMPGQLTIVKLYDAESLRPWCQTLGEGFEMPDFIVEAFYEVFLYLGFGDEVPVRHYLGLVQGKPVATSSLFLGEGVAGIYDVATIPEARRQGIGAAMTIQPLQEAQTRGYPVGILQSSEMGFPVYRRIGSRNTARSRFIYGSRKIIGES